ncbi:MAG: hypothetical protein R3F19_26095 [Verrucomicrobiales bacterium]
MPDDWGMFHLGCKHCARPEVLANGLVRVTEALDLHAWGVRAPHYGTVMRALTGRLHRTTQPFTGADIFTAMLHRDIPTYAVYPNLAWQAEEHSDLLGGVFSSYREDGTHARTDGGSARRRGDLRGATGGEGVRPLLRSGARRLAAALAGAGSRRSPWRDPVGSWKLRR